MRAERSAGPDLPETRHQLENEVSMVTAAIDLVASGAVSRVTLAGLHFGQQVADTYGADASKLGVRLEPLYWPDDAGCDLDVRRDDCA